jgi:hypothetical protein
MSQQSLGIHQSALGSNQLLRLKVGYLTQRVQMGHLGGCQKRCSCLNQEKQTLLKQSSLLSMRRKQKRNHIIQFSA